MNSLKWKERKGGKEMERDRWGSECVRDRWRLLKREREREKDEESMRIGRERESPGKRMCRNFMPTINMNTL